MFTKSLQATSSAQRRNSARGAASQIFPSHHRQVDDTIFVFDKKAIATNKRYPRSGLFQQNDAGLRNAACNLLKKQVLPILPQMHSSSFFVAEQTLLEAILAKGVPAGQV